MKALIQTLAIFFTTSFTFANRPPNIVVMMVDDMGFAGPSIAPYSNPHYKTPGMDRLASEGMRFTDFHSSGTVCSPTRTGLLTGRYQQRAGIEAVIHPRANHPEHRKWLKASEVTFAELFQQADYSTGLIGKWHLGYPEGNDEVHPQNHGFDYFKGYHSGNIDFINHWGDHMKHDWWHGRKETVEEGYTTHLINKYVLEFIEANRDKPFCLYVAHEAPHSPVQGPNDPPQRGPGRKKRITPHTEAMRQMILEMDKGVEQARTKLVELGLEKNTLFLFFSDNGDAPGTATGSPRFRGHKGSVYEGGTRVPAIAWWPGKIEAGSSTDVLSITLDVMPTILSVAGIEPDAGKALDGVDLSPVLFEQKELEKRPLFWASLSNGGSRSEAMRDGLWKLVVQHPKAKPGTFENEQVELFDLSKDESEERNLATEHPDRAVEMFQRIKDWYAETQETATVQPGGWLEATSQAETPQWSARINAVDPGSQDEAWAKPGFDDSNWKTMKLPGHFEKAGLPGHDGVVWFRKTLVLSTEQAKTAKPMLGLGQIDDMDVTWINGRRIGGYEVPGHYYTVRNYKVPAGMLQVGKNTIAVRVMDHRAVGGIAGKPEQLGLKLGDVTISLANEWKMAPGVNLAELRKANPIDQPKPTANGHSSSPLDYGADIGSEEIENRPNILFICTDDQAPWALGASGNKQAVTPNMDKLVSEGAYLVNSFVTTPVCSPSRAATLTGLYGHEVGVRNWVQFGKRAAGQGLNPVSVTSAELLKKAGYKTSLIGKWHLGEEPHHYPNKHGFDYFMGHIQGGFSVNNPRFQRNGKPVRFEGLTADVLADDVISRLESHAAEGQKTPFFIKWHTRAPHTKWLPVAQEDMAPYDKSGFRADVPDYPNLDREKVDRWMREYLASTRSVDRNLGRVMGALKKMELSENTIVIYTSDHGYNMGHHGIWHKGNGHWILKNQVHRNGNIGANQRPNMWENSIRVPSFVRWPGKIKPGSRIEADTTNLDWFPTILTMAGVKQPANLRVRGENLVPLLTGKASDTKRDGVFSFLSFYEDYARVFIGELRMWRTDRWKLVRDFRNPHLDELYDLKEDPDETTNQINNPAHKKLVQKLHERIIAEMRDSNDPALQYLPLETKTDKKTN